MKLQPIRVSKKGNVFRKQLRDPEAFHKAFAMYIHGKPATDICTACNTTPHELSVWARTNDWTRQRNALLNESTQNTAKKLQTLQETSILEVAETNLAMARDLSHHIQKHLVAKGKIKPRDLSELSRAAVSAGKLGSDTVGLSEATTVATKKPSPIQFGILLNITNIPQHTPQTVSTINILPDHPTTP